MKACLIVSIFIVSTAFTSFAQYATTGSGSLRNEIWWFDWANMNIAENATRNFTTADGLNISIKLSNLSGHKPVPEVMNTWSGALLHLLYNFTDPTIKPALLQQTTGGFCRYTLNITATRAGVAVPFTIVAADAEGSAYGELTTLTTDGEKWQTITLFRNSGQTNNPLRNCNTKSVSIEDTYDGSPQYGQNPIVATKSVSGSLKLDVDMDHGPTTGGMAMAFGILAPVDRGDLPPSYGAPLHLLSYTINNPCNYLAPLPSISPAQSLYLGNMPADADAYAVTDDNALGADEEGVSTFPQYVYGSGTYSVQVTTTNLTGNNAYVSSWLDYNRNGLFEPAEAVQAVVPNNATSATLTWTGLPTYLPQGASSGYAFRFRISSSQTAVQTAIGNAPDGEVEDYFVASEQLCTPLNVRTRKDTTVCGGEPVQLETTGGIQYTWNTGVYLNDMHIGSPVATPQATTTYIVTGFNPQGCSAKDTVVISISSIVVIDVSDDQVICEGTSTPLLANAPDAVSYSWSPQTGMSDATDANPTVTPAVTTRYEVTVTNNVGCSGKRALKVVVVPQPVFAAGPANVAVCEKEMVVVEASGGDVYTWLDTEDEIIGNNYTAQFIPEVSGDYKVNIRNSICLRDTTIIIAVGFKAAPVTSITKTNDIDCLQGQATLHITGASSYVWDEESTLKNNRSANPVVRPLESTMYHVTTTGSNGCSSRDSIRVIVDRSAAVGTFPVPSAFTPNGDGKNDCFGLKLWGAVINLQFDVFNRWGQRVFTTTDPAACWDGNFNGIAQGAGGYIYVINATTLCGSVSRKGMVMLIR